VDICVPPYLVDADVLEAGEELPRPRDVLLALLVLDRTGQQALQSGEAGTGISLRSLLEKEPLWFSWNQVYGLTLVRRSSL
jgi:hypothetical protein